MKTKITKEDVIGLFESDYRYSNYFWSTSDISKHFKVSRYQTLKLLKELEKDNVVCRSLEYGGGQHLTDYWTGESIYCKTPPVTMWKLLSVSKDEY
jgi:CTP-dependent riboflavin kinase